MCGAAVTSTSSWIYGIRYIDDAFDYPHEAARKRSACICKTSGAIRAPNRGLGNPCRRARNELTAAVTDRSIDEPFIAERGVV